jgi:hypothetical protein
MKIILHRPNSDDTVTVPAEHRPQYPGWMFMGEAPEPKETQDANSRKRTHPKARKDATGAQSTGVPA